MANSGRLPRWSTVSRCVREHKPIWHGCEVLAGACLTVLPRLLGEYRVVLPEALTYLNWSAGRH